MVSIIKHSSINFSRYQILLELLNVIFVSSFHLFHVGVLHSPLYRLHSHTPDDWGAAAIHSWTYSQSFAFGQENLYPPAFKCDCCFSWQSSRSRRQRSRTCHGYSRSCGRYVSHLHSAENFIPIPFHTVSNFRFVFLLPTPVFKLGGHWQMWSLLLDLPRRIPIDKKTFWKVSSCISYRKLRIKTFRGHFASQ